MKQLPSKRIADKRGQRFGRLAVIEYVGQNYHYESQWLCKCDCGNYTTVLTGQLMAGYVLSCGCLKRELALNRNKTHGKTNTRLFHIWQGMRSRCNNSKHKDYKNYGGRGISVCQEWDSSFEAFHSWALQHGYRPNLTIDRENNNGNYEPTNCRWTTKKVQANNTRKNLLITINGETKTLTEWSEISGLNWTTLKYRYKNGDTGTHLLRPLERKRHAIS